MHEIRATISFLLQESTNSPEHRDILTAINEQLPSCYALARSASTARAHYEARLTTFNQDVVLIEDKKKWFEEATQTRAQLILREKRVKEAIVRAKEMLLRLEAKVEDCANKIAIADVAMTKVDRDTKSTKS